jgi:hypothetical protein
MNFAKPEGWLSWRLQFFAVHCDEDIARTNSRGDRGALLVHIKNHPSSTAAVLDGSQRCANGALCFGWLRVGPVEIGVARFQPCEQLAHPSFEGQIIPGCQCRRPPVHIMQPNVIVDIGHIEVVLQYQGLDSIYDVLPIFWSNHRHSHSVADRGTNPSTV